MHGKLAATIYALWAAALVFGFVAGGCSSGTATSYGVPKVARLRVGLAVPARTAHVMAPDPVSIRITVSGADFGTLSQTVPVGTPSAELLVPQGVQRAVQLVYLTAAGEVLGTAQAVVDVLVDPVVVNLTLVAGVPGIAVGTTSTAQLNVLQNQNFAVTSDISNNTNSPVQVTTAGHRFRISGSLTDMSGSFSETAGAPVPPFTVAAGVNSTYNTNVTPSVMATEGLYQIDAVVEGTSPTEGAFGIRTSLVPATVRLIHEHVLTTIAGDGAAGNQEQKGTTPLAEFNDPTGVAAFNASALLVGDTGNNEIRMVQPGAASSTLAGTGSNGVSADGAGATTSAISLPGGVGRLSSGAVVFAETGNNKIRAFVPGGALFTVAGNGQPGYAGDGLQANNAAVMLDAPEDVVVVPGGGRTSDTLYVADTANNVVRLIASSGIISTVAGRGPTLPGDGGDNGPPTSASLLKPHAVCVDLQGNLLIAQDTLDSNLVSRGLIRKVDFSANTITTIAGVHQPPFFTTPDPEGQPATSTRLDPIHGIAVDSSGLVYFTEQGSASGQGRVRLIDPEGNLRTVAGGGANPPAITGTSRPATGFALSFPSRIFFRSPGLAFANSGGNTILGLQ